MWILQKGPKLTETVKYLLLIMMNEMILVNRIIKVTHFPRQAVFYEFITDSKFASAY